MPVLQVFKDVEGLDRADQLLHIVLHLVVLPKFEYGHHSAQKGVQLFYLLEVIILGDYFHSFCILIYAMDLDFNVIERLGDSLNCHNNHH